LTYMSIDERIAELLDKELFAVEPLFGGRVVRHILVSKEVWDLIDRPPKKWSVRCAKIRADLERFVTGDEIKVCRVPFKADGAYLGLLDPTTSGIWDIRCVDPTPAVRLIGCFADKDVFVALIPAARSVPTDLLFRGPLHDKGSVHWDNVITECDTTWWTIFHHNDRVRSNDVHDLISDKSRIVGEEEP
jgi:hypothetical protein